MTSVTSCHFTGNEMHRAIAIIVIALSVVAHVDASDRTLNFWTHVLNAPPPAPAPPPLDSVTWRDDFAAALAEAKLTNRPVFVTLRCLPCKQCSAFDKDVLEGGPTLTPLLKQFITVRLTDAAKMDFRYLPVEGFQDLDMSWWGWFLSPNGKVYGVFGGKDHVSDATRISEAALVNTMQRVLDHHYDPRREQLNMDGPAPDMSLAVRHPQQLPTHDQWKSDRPWVQKQTCIHCHQVQDMLRLRDMNVGKFDKNRDVWVWPLPENVGIHLDRDHGLRVTKVEPNSPAAKVGLQPGDELAAAESRLLFGQADFRGVLHRGPKGAGDIQLVWRRGDDIRYGSLRVADGWRETVLDWRITISQGVIGTGPGFFPLKGPKSNKMSIKPWWGKNEPPIAKAGLRKNHVLIAVDGESPPVHGREFLTWFRFRYNAGDTVTFTVREGNRTRDIEYTLPE